MLGTGTADLGLTNLENSDSSLDKSQVGSKPLLDHVKLELGRALPTLVKPRHGLPFSKVTSQWTDQLTNVRRVSLYLELLMMAFTVR
jgi:hypothetical protein